MPVPVPKSVAQEILAALEPMLYADATNGYPLTIFLNANSEVLIQEIEDYVSDDPITGAIGYSVWLDIDRTPDKALAWLAQFVGVSLVGGITPADQRQQIRDLPNWRRGTVNAMHDAPKPFLTGSKSVIFRERFGGPGKLTVYTYVSQTPDAAKVLQALLAQKPAGITLTYNTILYRDYLSVYNTNATYAILYGKYTTYNGLLIDTPGA